jgi:hypothetical protein
MASRKRISDQQHDGGHGESLAELLVKEMGHEYHRADRNEAGIDGFIELRHGGSGEVDAQIVVCQVKTGETSMFDETATAFSWRAEPGDLVYWENSNAPVIVVVVRLATREGWWRAVDEAFAYEDARAARVVRFDKIRDRLDGAPPDALWEVVRRARDRRAAAARMAISGPYATIGLNADLETALGLERQGRPVEAADAWNALADAASAKGLERRLVWPARQAAARACQYAGQRMRAGEIWLALAAERVDDDDPEASFDVGRAQWTGAWTGSFDQVLIAARAALPEAGVDGLDELRRAAALASGARERQAAAAALVDGLVFFGLYGEAFPLADEVLGKRHDTAHKRQLVLDWLDCAGELGHAVERHWLALIDDWRDRGPHLYGRVLQRRAVFALRRGDLDEANSRFHAAAEVWAATDGGEEQVAEVTLSASLADSLSGQLQDAMPPGARAAAAIARGSIRTPAVRSDRLLLEGLSYLADGKRPDALARLTLAAMVDRRAGNLFSWRRTAYMLARAYEDADEYAEALRFWILVGAEGQTAEIAPKVDAEVVLGLLRLGDAPAWVRAAGLAALELHTPALTPAVVAALAPDLVQTAVPTPRLVAPQPSFYARRTLARICDRLPAELAEATGQLLSEDVRVGAPNAPESSRGLVALTRRRVFDGIPVILDALLAGDQLPVTVAPWLRDADEVVRESLVVAALAGNRVALSEAAAADLPMNDARLQEACDQTIAAMVDHEPQEAGSESLGVSFVEFADLARFARPETQSRYVDLLLDVVASSRYDEVSKTSALVTLAMSAPGLAATHARRALTALLPIAAGAPVESVPGELTDHHNPKRARTRLSRTVSASALRAAAVQACGRLARRADPESIAVDEMLIGALDSRETEVIRMALRELAGLPALGRDVDPIPWSAHPEAVVRSAADQLARARRGEATTD